MGIDHGRAYVFHTPWFLGLMGLLLVNLCLCSWEKSYIALTLYKKRNFKNNPVFYRKASHATCFSWTGTAEEINEKLKKTYTIVAEKDGSYYAQKGLFGRTGATIIHIGLLWTMMAGFYRIVADDIGFGIYDSTVILAEGQTGLKYFTRVDRLKEPSSNNLKEKDLPFTLRALDFNAEYFPHSTVAKKFSAIIELHDPANNKKLIHEVTMASPLVYNGYKITQNSFSPNENIIRGKFRIKDLKTGKISEIDAIPGDPVPVRLDDHPDTFIQVKGLEGGKDYHIVNLANGIVVEDGVISTEEKLPLPLNLSPYQSQLNQSKYSVLIGALFPNFVLDENNQPTTENEQFINPAVLTMVFKKGKFNGYAWVFNHKEAQDIVGQPHPELEFSFPEYRNTSESTATATLLDYEVLVHIKEKQSGKDLGQIWLKPGELKELEVSPEIINSAIVSTGAAASAHAATSETLTAPVGSPSAPASASVPPVAGQKFEVTYLGPVTGNVTFLGVMKDPSVIWMYIGCFIIIFGTMVAFMFVYRETWVFHDKENGLLYMATAVRGTSPGAHREFDKLVDSFQAAQEPSSLTDNRIIPST